MRSRALPAVLVAAALLLAGCGSQGDPDGARSQTSSASSKAPSPSPSASAEAENMDMDMGSADEPSGPASMICSAEIRDAVRRTFEMRGLPRSTSDWSRSDRVYSCRHRVPGGTLALSVQDALDEDAGGDYFADLQRRTPGAQPIRGMESFGFPSFDTAGGRVAFLKDGKTLVVDASRLPARALPPGYDRREAAYSVAAAVIACWSE